MDNQFELLPDEECSMAEDLKKCKIPGLFSEKTNEHLMLELQEWRVNAIKIIFERLTDKEKLWISQSGMEPYKYIDGMVCVKRLEK